MYILVYTKHILVYTCLQIENGIWRDILVYTSIYSDIQIQRQYMQGYDVYWSIYNNIQVQANADTLQDSEEAIVTPLCRRSIPFSQNQSLWRAILSHAQRTKSFLSGPMQETWKRQLTNFHCTWCTMRATNIYVHGSDMYVHVCTFTYKVRIIQTCTYKVQTCIYRQCSVYRWLHAFHELYRQQCTVYIHCSTVYVHWYILSAAAFWFARLAGLQAQAGTGCCLVSCLFKFKLTSSIGISLRPC